MSATRHLLTVWNPSYATDAMDEHLKVLLAWGERAAKGVVDFDEVYVWWGKVRSANRRQPLPHAADILALKDQLDEVETHLYLTDYRSLYVGHLVDIEGEGMLEEYPEERDHIPAYYEKLPVDFWFQLWDIRRIVADDTPAVIEELKKLRNTRYHDRPVSLYGGIVDLPLIVARDDGVRWFADRDLVVETGLWAERDARLRSETERMARELRDNLLGRDVWGALDPATRTFLASAEAVFRARRDDPYFDFSGPVVEYTKAVETEVNAILFPGIRRALAGRGPGARETRIEGRRVDLGGAVPHQPLGCLIQLLEKDQMVQYAVRAAFPHDHAWILGELPRCLEQLRELRNPCAHSDASRREEVARRREEVLGIGQEGLIARLARVKLRAR